MELHLREVQPDELSDPVLQNLALLQQLESEEPFFIAVEHNENENSEAIYRSPFKEYLSTMPIRKKGVKADPYYSASCKYLH